MYLYFLEFLIVTYEEDDLTNEVWWRPAMAFDFTYIEEEDEVYIETYDYDG